MKLPHWIRHNWSPWGAPRPHEWLGRLVTVQRRVCVNRTCMKVQVRKVA